MANFDAYSSAFVVLSPTKPIVLRYAESGEHPQAFQLSHCASCLMVTIAKRARKVLTLICQHFLCFLA
jgi:hypothetical protein